MGKVKDIYIPYLNTGYSENTVQDLLCDMKIYHLEDHEKIRQKALEIFTAQNDAILERNSNRHFIVKVIDTVLWALSFGFLRLLEREIQIDQLMATANKIQNYVFNTPLINQTDRSDYSDACEIIRLEEEAKQQEIEKLEQELQEKEEELQAVIAKLEDEVKQHEASKNEQEFKTKEAALQGEILQKQEEVKKIRKELKGKLKTDEQRRIKSLKARWLDDVSAEHARLQAKGLTPQQQLNMSGDQFEVIIGRVRELKEHYKATHYVFTHGQGKGLAVINECMQRLLENFTPSLHDPLLMPFRLPHSVDVTENVTEFFKKYPNIETDAFNDDALNRITGELLSVDPYWLNTEIYESALHFFATGTNINMGGNPNIGEDIFRNIFINYLEDNYLCDMVAKKAAGIAADHGKANKMGSLWAICIPKSVVMDPSKNMAYRAHAFGRKCTCHSPTDDIKVLERLQKDEAVQCYGWTNPQYRLLTARLVPERGVRSFPVNSLTKVENKDFSKRIKNLVREIALYSAIVGLRSAPSAEESVRLNEELKALCESKQIDPSCLEYLLLTQRDNLTPELLDTIQLAMFSLTPEEHYAFV